MYVFVVGKSFQSRELSSCLAMRGQLNLTPRLIFILIFQCFLRVGSVGEFKRTLKLRNPRVFLKALFSSLNCYLLFVELEVFTILFISLIS